MSLSSAIKDEARALGFARSGILPAGLSRTHGFYEAWLAQGYAGEMGYLARHAEPKRDPGLWMEGARSLICLALPYNFALPEAAPPGRLTPQPPLQKERGSFRAGPHGRVSRYARGRDYHEVIGERLETLAGFIQQRIEQPLRYRTSVDAQPLMEREWAARAGLGWVGKNAMLINWELGSYLFLAELAVDIELDYDVPVRKRLPPQPSDGDWPQPGFPALRDPALGGTPPQGCGSNLRTEPGPLPAGLRPVDLGLRESCGSCRACIDACPTAAIVADRTIDARRCISYLTIELKGPIPPELREPMGDWVFGCDICQDVCPWNRRGGEPGSAEFTGGAEFAEAPEFAATAAATSPSLVELLQLDEAGFRARYRHSPIWRTHRRGLARNAAIAMGNAAPGLQGNAKVSALQALAQTMRDPEPVVRGAAAWALGRFVDARARDALEQARRDEGAPMVWNEIDAALALPSEAFNQE